MFKALAYATVAEVALVLLYMFASKAPDALALEGTAIYVYSKYEILFLFNLLESIIPAAILGYLLGKKGRVYAVLFRAVTFVPTFMIYGSDLVTFLSGRPLSLHLTYLICAYMAAWIAADQLGARSQESRK